MAPSPRKLRSSLDVPDDPAWHIQRGYSPALAAALTRAYREIHGARAHPDAYFEAYRALAPFRDRPLCDEQRMHVEYALALAYAGDNAAPYALECLAQAREIAERLDDRAALVEIGYLAGGLLHWQTRHADAYAVYEDALAALWSLGRGDDEEGQPADPTFELDLTLRLAWRAWELGRFPVCLRHLDRAYTLRAAWAPGAAQEAVSLAWLDAQLSRVRGQPGRARDFAAAAAELALAREGPLNAGRAHTILAECTLDAAEHLVRLSDPGANGAPRDLRPDPGIGRGETPAGLLGRARTAAQQALDLAREAHDQVGAGMARLALRRAARCARGAHAAHAPGAGGGAGVRAAEEILRTARRLRDVSLEGRALTALADELAWAGRDEDARRTYHHAARLLEEHQLGGLAFWPRRALGT